MIWFSWVLLHINHCRLFNAKSFLYIYIEYIWLGLVGFYGLSNIVGYLMPNPLYTYISNIYDWVLLHINHCRLFNAKSFLYIYIEYIWFGLVRFYGISTITGYLMSNPVYTYILDIYDLLTYFVVNIFKWVHFFCSQFKCFYVSQIILFTINHLFAQTYMVSSIAM